MAKLKASFCNTGGEIDSCTGEDGVEFTAALVQLIEESVLEPGDSIVITAVEG